MGRNRIEPPVNAATIAWARLRLALRECAYHLRIYNDPTSAAISEEAFRVLKQTSLYYINRSNDHPDNLHPAHLARRVPVRPGALRRAIPAKEVTDLTPAA